MTQKNSVFCLEVSYGCDKEGRSGCPGDEKSLDGSFCSDLSTSNREGLSESFTLLRFLVFICKMGFINKSRLGGAYEVIGWV